MSALHASLTLQPVLAQHGITQSELGRALGLSKSAAFRLVAHGQLPVRGAADVRQRAVDFFKARGVSLALIRNLVLPPPPLAMAEPKEVGPTGLHPGEAAGPR